MGVPEVRADREYGELLPQLRKRPTGDGMDLSEMRTHGKHQQILSELCFPEAGGFRHLDLREVRTDGEHRGALH